MFDSGISTTLTTLAVIGVTFYFLGVYTASLISPEDKEARRRNLTDLEESAESDIDEIDTNLDHAPNWTNSEEADRRQGLKASAQRPTQQKSSVAASLTEALLKEEHKLVLVVRTDLGMTKGKIAAQCGHATLACYKRLRSRAASHSSPEALILSRWEKGGQAKIALQTKEPEELVALQRKARDMGLTAEVICDAGKTQIEAGSMTTLGVGPAPKSLVDNVTGHLKLL